MAEVQRKPFMAGQALTYLCRARHAQDSVAGRLEFVLVDPKGHRTPLVGHFIVVEATNAARLSTIRFTNGT